MENSQNYLQSFVTNPGFQHLGEQILRHLNKKTALSLRSVNHSCKKFVDNPRFWLKKLNYKNIKLHEAWSSLIQKVKEENADLEEIVVVTLLERPSYWVQKTFQIRYFG